mmetsp:Transcript_37076/g.56883  ORF Transcript_37076/g.56883 Transcript_37076/m.56883 type:complete len:80 (-) Transcript_37076:34-273(-)
MAGCFDYVPKSHYKFKVFRSVEMSEVSPASFLSKTQRRSMVQHTVIKIAIRQKNTHEMDGVITTAEDGTVRINYDDLWI